MCAIIFRSSTDRSARRELRSGRRLPVGDFPDAIAGGDFDRDGGIDLATANAGGDDASVLLKPAWRRAYDAPAVRISVTVFEASL